jgi:hypothetical protein
VALGFDTLFLDAGGVLVQPSFARISAALGRRGTHARRDGRSAAREDR